MKDENDFKKEKPDLFNLKNDSGFVCPNCGSTSSLYSNNVLGCSYCFFTYPMYFGDNK